jgi:thiol-disulfide isomerase/thioredoxin
MFTYKNSFILALLVCTAQSYAAVINLNSEQDFANLVLQNNGPVIVKFSIKGCPPCQRFAPIFEQMSNQVKGATFIAADGNKIPRILSAYDIDSFPLVLYFNNRTLKGKVKGFKDFAGLRKDIAKLLGI